MVKAIFFDFGNVLYDLNFDLFYHNISTLLELDPGEELPESMIQVVHDYDKGIINTETFIWRIQKFKKGDLSPRSIINCWNSLLDQFPSHRWDFLKALKSRYRLFLLSNINELHLSTVYKHIKNVHGRVDFETEYFDGVFYSHLIKMIKPEPEIYRFVVNVTNIRGEELLFIDDKEENISAAQAEGWNAVLHDPQKDIVSQFEEYLKPYL